MVTLGSIAREHAARLFPFLAENVRGRRAAIKQFTHRDPDFVFWIYPDGRVHDARDSHLKNPPRGFEHIVHDEPDYGGFLRGRVASQGGSQLVVVYCREEALASDGVKLQQFFSGIERLPVPVRDDALVISDNGDLYGTLDDVRQRRSGGDE
jgi:hypothetical protein